MFFVMFFYLEKSCQHFLKFCHQDGKMFGGDPTSPASKSTQHIPSNCSLLDVKLLGVAR